jgi:hypothetical protein
MRKLTELQIQELQSFGYMVRNNDDLENMEKKLDANAKEFKPLSVKLPSKDLDDVEVMLEHVEHVEHVKKTDDYSYLDELET